MAKTLKDYAEAHRRDPFPWPMPGDEVIMIGQPSADTEHAAVLAAREAGTLAGGLLAGVRVYAGEEYGQKIADAYGQLPAAVLSAVVADMRSHFSTDS